MRWSYSLLIKNLAKCQFLVYLHHVALFGAMNSTFKHLSSSETTHFNSIDYKSVIKNNKITLFYVTLFSGSNKTLEIIFF